MHNHAPSYLTNLLPQPNDNNPYNPRNNQNQKQFRFNTSKFQKSLLPDCINKWNELDINKRRIPDVCSFKKSISNPLVSIPYFYGHNRALGLIHSQLRMRCSNLKAHLFNLHVIDSPQCVCMTGIEDCSHYFLTCPLYNTERNKLLHNVQLLCNVSVDVLLFGNKSLCANENSVLFRHVEVYISETERFAKSVVLL